jgi:hypothetical protein
MKEAEHAKEKGYRTIVKNSRQKCTIPKPLVKEKERIGEKNGGAHKYTNTPLPKEI